MAVNNFKEAVESTPEVASGYCVGLRALGKNSVCVKVADSHCLEGSLDIDSEVKNLYANQNRWDYSVGYSGKAYFIEVHPASSSDVRVVLAKLAWLKQWLIQKAPALNNMKSPKPFYWVQTKSCGILKTSAQYRAAVAASILPVNKVELK